MSRSIPKAQVSEGKCDRAAISTSPSPQPKSNNTRGPDGSDGGKESAEDEEEEVDEEVEEEILSEEEKVCV